MTTPPMTPPVKGWVLELYKRYKRHRPRPPRSFMFTSSEVCKLFMVLHKINNQHIVLIVLSIVLFNLQHNMEGKSHYYPIL